MGVTVALEMMKFSASQMRAANYRSLILISVTYANSQNRFLVMDLELILKKIREIRDETVMCHEF